MDPQIVEALHKVAIIVACAAGAYSSFAFGEKIAPRSKMFQLWMACVFMGWAFSVVTTATVHYWFPKFDLAIEVRAGLSAIVSCLTRFIIPAVIERIGPWLDRIPFLRKKES